MKGPSPAHPISVRAEVGNCPTCWRAIGHSGKCKKHAAKCRCHKNGKKRKGK